MDADVQAAAGYNPRGGRGKRRASCVVARSKLADLLEELHAWGVLSATLVQLICAAAVADGFDDERVKKFAHIGTEGRNIQNSRRDLFSASSVALLWNCPFRVSTPNLFLEGRYRLKPNS